MTLHVVQNWELRREKNGVCIRGNIGKSRLYQSSEVVRLSCPAESRDGQYVVTRYDSVKLGSPSENFIDEFKRCHGFSPMPITEILSDLLFYDGYRKFYRDGGTEFGQVVDDKASIIAALEVMKRAQAGQVMSTDEKEFLKKFDQCSHFDNWFHPGLAFHGYWDLRPSFSVEEVGKIIGGRSLVTYQRKRLLPYKVIGPIQQWSLVGFRDMLFIRGVAPVGTPLPSEYPAIVLPAANELWLSTFIENFDDDGCLWTRNGEIISLGEPCRNFLAEMKELGINVHAKMAQIEWFNLLREKKMGKIRHRLTFGFHSNDKNPTSIYLGFITSLMEEEEGVPMTRDDRKDLIDIKMGKVFGEFNAPLIATDAKSYFEEFCSGPKWIRYASLVKKYSRITYKGQPL
jgi:hypothetical protein